MLEKASALYSSYVIDGVQMDATPSELLDATVEDSRAFSSDVAGSEIVGKIVDETVEPVVRFCDLTSLSVEDCLKTICHRKHSFPLPYASFYTRLGIASAILDCIWRVGSFRLGDLLLDLSWTWQEHPLGAMAAFYESTSAASDYLDALSLRISRYSYLAGDESHLGICAEVRRCEEDDEFVGEPFRSAEPRMESFRAVPSQFVPDEKSWIIYIPFDSADFLLGGSLLSQEFGLGGAAPQIEDADYFQDCYEVVREFVEDGILLSGASVSEGGLASALAGMCSGACGLEAEIGDLMSAYQETDPLRPLFAEIPGVVLQIRNSDFDYLDAELLLQDVAYFPLGHPSSRSKGLKVSTSDKTQLQTILQSLMQKAEGED